MDTLMLTPREVERELRLGRSKTYELLRSGAIRGVVKVGRLTRIPRASLEDWVEAQSDDGDAADPGGSAASGRASGGTSTVALRR